MFFDIIRFIQFKRFNLFKLELIFSSQMIATIVPITTLQTFFPSIWAFLKNILATTHYFNNIININILLNNLFLYFQYFLANNKRSLKCVFKKMNIIKRFKWQLSLS